MHCPGECQFLLGRVEVWNVIRCQCHHNNKRSGGQDTGTWGKNLCPEIDITLLQQHPKEPNKLGASGFSGISWWSRDASDAHLLLNESLFQRGKGFRWKRCCFCSSGTKGTRKKPPLRRRLISETSGESSASSSSDSEGGFSFNLEMWLRD